MEYLLKEAAFASNLSHLGVGDPEDALTDVQQRTARANGLEEALPPLTRNEAAVEAARCLMCYDAPCTHACPTHIDIPKFIKKIATENLRGSARTILESNLLGATCARVCPVQELCEGACVLGAEHKPIAIGRLQRHAMDFVYAKGIDMFRPGKATGKKVAVIGAGPAGLSCARTVYKNVELKATDVATTNNFPITFSMEGPGGGTMKIDGKVGPVDPKDAAFTPQDVKLTINNLNLASTGFLDPSLGLAGLVDMDAGLKSQGGKMSMKGKLTVSKAVLVQGGKPSGVPAIINFDTVYDLAAGSGMLNPSTLNIGNAKSNLSGTYKSVGDDFVVDMKIDGQGLPATDLESFLPALGVNLPSGSRLSAITLSTNLHVTGPTNKLVTDGNIGPFKGKLSTGLAGGKAGATSDVVNQLGGPDRDGRNANRGDGGATAVSRKGRE